MNKHKVKHHRNSDTKTAKRDHIRTTALERSVKTILDNSDKVGQNRLTYMETINIMPTRSKIYNKMAQMLECKGVPDTIGCHGKDLGFLGRYEIGSARDDASQSGLTWAEVIFYCQIDIPTDEIM